MNELSSIPTDEEVAREPDRVRRELLGAMQRILIGAPRSAPPGSMSVLQLAVEAGVHRQYLYRNHPDIRLRFLRLVEAPSTHTEPLVKLKTRLDDAKAELLQMTQLQAATRQEAQNWKELVDLLHRAINVLQEELRSEQIKTARLEKKLRRVAREPTSLVVPIRPRNE